MLPVKDLVYPGAVETSRSYTDAVKGRSVDGGTLDRDAYLYRRFSNGPPNFDDVRDWYKQQLSTDGWEPLNSDPHYSTPRQIAMTTVRNGLIHKIVVDAIGLDEDRRFGVKYYIDVAH